jgi:uncharacterized membrane protein
MWGFVGVFRCSAPLKCISGIPVWLVHLGVIIIYALLGSTVSGVLRLDPGCDIALSCFI